MEQVDSRVSWHKKNGAFIGATTVWFCTKCGHRHERFFPMEVIEANPAATDRFDDKCVGCRTPHEVIKIGHFIIDE